jgi:rhodanese-related sulfurtransferase
MASGEHDQELRTAYWEAKLAAETEILDVVRHVENGTDEYVLLDARQREAWERERIPGAVSIPPDSVADVAATLDPERQYVLYCWRSTCHLAAKAALELVEHGLDVKEMNAGWREWQAGGWPTEGPEAA